MVHGILTFVAILPKWILDLGIICTYTSHAHSTCILTLRPLMPPVGMNAKLSLYHIDCPDLVISYH